MLKRNGKIICPPIRLCDRSIVKSFFSPAIRFIGTRRYRSKLLLLSCLVLVPLLGVTAMLTIRFQDDIRRLERAHHGLHVAPHLLQLMADAGRAGGYALLDDHAARESILVRIRNERWPAVRHNLKTQGLESGATRELEASLDDAAQAPSEYLAYLKLAESAGRLLQHVAEDSGLLLARNSSDRLLADTLVVKLPALMLATARIRDVGAQALSRQRLRGKDRQQLLVTRGALAPLLDWISQNITRAGELNTALGNALQPATDKLNQDMLAAEARLTLELLDTMTLDTPAKAYFAGVDSGVAATGTLAESLTSQGIARLQAEIVRATQQRNLMLFMAATGLFGLLYLGVGAYLSILGSIRSLSDATARLGDGDLGARADILGRDELTDVAHGFNRMAEALAQLIADSQRATEQLGSAVTAMSNGAERIVSASSAQHDAAEQAAASVQQLTVGIHEVATHAEDTASLSQRASEVAMRGASQAATVARDISDLSQSLSDTSARATRLEAHSRDIGGIVQTIKEIADQTNLLALNAAIEAARAGDRGRGFAVVADEVRCLADRTAQSTRQIASTIETVQAEVGEVTTALGAVSAHMQQRAQSIGALSDGLAELQGEVDAALAHVQGIVTTTAEQREAGNQISQRVQQMAVIAEENFAAARNSGGIASDLSALSHRLRQTVSGFRLAPA